MNITGTEHLILSLLFNGSLSSQYGLELVGKSKNKLKKNTIYAMLQRLEQKGFIQSKKENTSVIARGGHRRLYRITRKGTNARDFVINLGKIV